MTQDDDIVAHAGPLAKLIDYCGTHFWFFLSGLFALVLWGVLAQLLEMHYKPLFACLLALVFTVAIWGVTFCLFINNAVDGAEDEKLLES